jgi:GDPmannose 4,6-dehydratase
MRAPMKRALIFGISGQDGAYLARMLLAKGYAVFGASRDAQMGSFAHLRRLNIADRVRLFSVAMTDLGSVLRLVSDVSPDEVYNLAGQSSVGLSFDQPLETIESIVIGTLNVLQALRFTDKETRFYNAGSGEVFGDTGATRANEATAFRPRSPYGIAKAAAYWEVANYRDAYGIYACTGILFNHESPLRPERFVTRKIVSAAVRIAREGGTLNLGTLSIHRDWGWAPEYVDAMWRMLQRPEPSDFVIASGSTNSLERFVELSFAAVGLDWRQHVERDDSLQRVTDIGYSAADPSAALRALGWSAAVTFEQVVAAMVQAEIEGPSASL